MSKLGIGVVITTSILLVLAGLYASGPVMLAEATDQVFEESLDDLDTRLGLLDTPNQTIDAKTYLDAIISAKATQQMALEDLRRVRGRLGQYAVLLVGIGIVQVLAVGLGPALRKTK